MSNGHGEPGGLLYEARKGSQEKVLEMLNNGQTLAIVDKHGRIPVEHIQKDILEAHLDNCVTIENTELDEDGWVVKLNYRTLLPEKDCDKLSNALKVIECISLSPEHKYLLQHPVIRSILYILWVGYRVTLFTSILQSALLCLFFLIYTVTDIYGLVFLAVFCIVAIIVEVIDCYTNPKSYIKNKKTYVDIFMICVSVTIVSYDIYSHNNFEHSKGYLEEDTIRVILSIGILVSTLEALLYLGFFPIFSKYTMTYMEVTKKFLKFLLYFSFLILAFACCFYIMMHNCETTFKEDNWLDENTNSTSKENNDDPFSTFGKAVYKTVILFTRFDKGAGYFTKCQPASRMLLLVFIFCIVIVLMGLLTGLAVQGIQAVEREEELEGIKTKIQYLISIDQYAQSNAFITNIYKTVVNSLPFLDRYKFYKQVPYDITVFLHFNGQNEVLHVTDSKSMEAMAKFSGNSKKDGTEEVEAVMITREIMGRNARFSLRDDIYQKLRNVVNKKRFAKKAAAKKECCHCCENLKKTVGRKASM